MSVNDVNPVPTVALLARSGPARERLREALAHAGVALVLEEDPGSLEPATLLAIAPQAVVVALEPAVEDALERLDAVLSSPDFTLVFDEAELAARREGWETQRWARHLAAKLHGHAHVLPPGAEIEEALLPEPGLADTPERQHVEAPLSFHLDEAVDMAAQLPGDSLYPPPGQDRPAVPTSLGNHNNWSLMDEAASTDAGTAAVAAQAPKPAFDFERLSLVEMESAPGPRGGARGAVVVLAGIGGPDALRRLLGALPACLDVPLLVSIPLDGARYGNLVKQMARVSPLPVELAEAGSDVQEGRVYILSDDSAIGVRDGGLYFQSHAQGLDLSTLPAAESAVVVLSGADLGRVGPALDLAEAGAWVGGQVGEACYDPAAATAVIAAGMFAGEPQELAQAISARWALPEQGEPQ